MKVFRYHGQGKELGDLSEYDVVVTSYGNITPVNIEFKTEHFRNSRL